MKPARATRDPRPSTFRSEGWRFDTPRRMGAPCVWDDSEELPPEPAPAADPVRHRLIGYALFGILGAALMYAILTPSALPR